MFKKIDKNEVRKAKHSRIRHTLKGTADMPRLNVLLFLLHFCLLS